MRRILMVAFHFPPFAGSSGVQRSLRFVQQLPAHSWQPIVLTATASAYENTATDLLDEVPHEIRVHRALALDASRHLALARRFPGFIARPDRWVNWAICALPLGLALIRHYRPDAIWSTYPIPTAHLIGGLLARASGLPWVADFRDPMVEDGYPADAATRRAFTRLEQSAVTRAGASVFVTEGAAAMYRSRYPERAHHICVIENGFDESSFENLHVDPAPLIPGKLTLLHSGLVYPSERDPSGLFAALATLRDECRLPPLLVRLRAGGHDASLLQLIEKFRLDGLVELAPPIPYREALTEMVRADGLLVLQAANCNQQIPAKVYEYLRAARPILCLGDPVGETARMLRRTGVRHVAPLGDADAIKPVLWGFLDTLGQALPDASMVAACGRRHRTAELAALLDALVVGAHAHHGAGRAS